MADNLSLKKRQIFFLFYLPVQCDDVVPRDENFPIFRGFPLFSLKFAEIKMIRFAPIYQNVMSFQSRTHQYPDLLLSVSVNYVAGAGDAYVTSESIFCKTPPILN